MSYLQRQMNALKFDKRLLELNIKSGTITMDEFNTHLTQLPDAQANAEQLDLASDNDSFSNDMNGGSHPAESPATTQPPRSTDPFGSGF